MSIGYALKKEKGLAVVVWDGVVTLDEWRAHLMRLLADPEFPGTSIQISDLRTASADPSIEATEIQQISDFLTPRREELAGRKVAIIAGEEFRRARLFEHSLKPLSVEVIVFNNVDTACTWLGIDPMETERNFQRIREELRGPAGAHRG